MAVKRIGMAAGALWMATACAPEPSTIGSAQLLTRISLDVRGVRPSPDEIAAVEEDPSKVDDFIDTYLQDPRFGDRIISMFGDIYRTRLDGFQLSASDFNLPDQEAFVNSVGEESLRRLAFIAQNDRPYSEIVTADYTMANEVLGAIYPVNYPAGGLGWKQVNYTDGRPTAGILTDNSFWWRYSSTFVNSNRGRANAISRTLLCQDYLSQPIRFERINLLDDNAIREAIRREPGCQGCHRTMDPLAANLWGFFYDNAQDPLDATFYHPEKELFWQFTNEVSPGYFGEQVLDLTDLGRHIAADPQLVECATKQVYEGLLARKATFDDTQSLTEHREAFVDGGTKLRDLFRSVLRSPEYRTDGVNDPRFTTIKSISVDQLASELEDLTGFKFVTPDGIDLYRRSDRGLRTLLGGADGFFVTVPSNEPTVTQALVMERLAETASVFVVNADSAIADPTQRKLFKDIDFTENLTSNPDAIRTQLQDLRLRILSERVDTTSEEITDDIKLWGDIFSINSDPKMAWAGVTAALLRDPAFMLY